MDFKTIEIHFKKSNRKTDQKCPEQLHMKPKLQNLSKRREKLLDVRQKARQII